MRVAVLTGLIALLVAPVSAVTVVPLSFPQLVTAATAVVHGRVTEVRGQWTADRRGIESLVTLDALRYLKGDLGGRVTVRVPGGEAGGLVNVIPGVPRLAPGDHVVLFLTTSGPSVPVITGTTQGVFRVGVDPRGGGLMVQPPAAVGIVPGVVTRGDVTRRPVSMTGFAEAVRQAQQVAR